MLAARAPPRGPSSHPKQVPGRSRVSIPTSAPRANRVVAPIPACCQLPPRPASPPSPSYAFVAGSDPVTAMDTGSAAVGSAASFSNSHHSVQLSQRSAQVSFESLAARIAQLSSEGHVLLAGDLNARVGAASQPWVTELSGGISAQLHNSDIIVNGHGRRLLHLCEETAMVLCTSRIAGDTQLSPASGPATTLSLLA
ncbi:TPA: hypothetical protein ACH3X1_004898 [Trebouxia sp. C0004]